MIFCVGWLREENTDLWVWQQLKVAALRILRNRRRRYFPHSPFYPPRHYSLTNLPSSIAPLPPSLLVQALLAEAKAASPTLCGETCVPSLDEIWARTTPCNIFERMHLHLQGSAEPCAYSWKISKLIKIINHPVEYPHFSNHPSKVGSSNLSDVVYLLLDRFLGSEPRAQVLLTCQLGNKQKMFYFLSTINRL